MVKTQDIFDLFSIGFDHLNCREILEAAVGYKVSRINVFQEQKTPLLNFCRKHGIACAESDFRIAVGHRNEGKGNWYNIGKISKSSQGLSYLYLSMNRKSAERAKSYDEGTDACSDKLGDLLKIPACCRKFYVQNRGLAVNKFFDDYCILTTENSGKEFRFNSKVNYLAQYFGYSLIHHFPCRWDCGASIKRSQDSLNIIKAFSTSWADTFLTNLRGCVIFENGKGVHKLQGVLKGGKFHYEPSRTKSTAATRLLAEIQSRSTVQIHDAFSFVVDKAEIKPKKPNSDTAVLYFE